MKNRFPRPLLALLLLAAASVACSVSAGTPQATERANGAGSLLSSADEPQATPGAFLMGENQEFATSTALPTINVQATQLFYISAIKTANAENNLIRQQLIDTNNEGKKIELAISANQAAAAKYEAANRATSAKETQSAVDMAANVAAQKEADNEAANIEVERIKALRAGDDNAVLFVLSAVAIGFILLMYKAMNRPHIVMEALPAPEAYQSPFSTALDSERTSKRRDLPAGVDEAHLIQLAQRVLTKRRPNGIPFSRQNWLHLMSRAEWEALVTDMLLERRAYKTHPNQANSGVALTDNGEGWLYLFEQLQPIPQADVSLKSSGMSSDILPGKVFPTAGGLSDDFKIMPQDGENVL